MIVPDLDYILSSRTKVRLLRALVQLGDGVSGRHAARLAGVSSKALQALDELAECGILKKTSSTAQFLFSWNSEHYLAQPLAALFAREEKKLPEIADRLKAAIGDRKEVVTAACYGSMARGDSQLASDLDLLVVMQSAERSDIVDRILEEAARLRPVYGVRISLFVSSEEKWQAMVRDRSPFALSTIQDAWVFIGRPLTAFA